MRHMPNVKKEPAPRTRLGRLVAAGGQPRSIAICLALPIRQLVSLGQRDKFSLGH